MGRQNLQLLLAPKTSHKVYLFLAWAEFGSNVLSNEVLVTKHTLVKLNYVIKASVAT